ncbi:MAG: translation initiation factor IF-3 [candidate division Zixibacteria bacterium RBG_19FT_COMBO_42_43]|nr:MAG: translation initiation factor IF-3 [candidate division Zixibacteria bacterium RBG_19FT_COMBO_42_43]
MREKELRVNERIRIPQVRVIGADGEQIGVLPTREAVKIALEKGLDLVEVSPYSRPPVCRIMNYGKYRYEQQKKAKDAKKKQHVIVLKEMHFRPKTEEHDYQFKTRHIREFLEDGNKVKVMVDFRGREMAHMDFGYKILERLINDLQDVGVIEQKAKQEGRNIIMIMMPKNQKGKIESHAKDKDQ